MFKIVHSEQGQSLLGLVTLKGKTALLLALLGNKIKFTHTLVSLGADREVAVSYAVQNSLSWILDELGASCIPLLPDLPPAIAAELP